MLSINFKKTNYMIITSPKKKTNIRITACNIEQKSQIKYLGVFIDEHLKWDAQLQHINNKITKNIGILFKLRHYVPISTLKQLYYTLIYPFLTYGLMSWGTAYQTKLNKIKVSQNNCIRCIFFANKRESPTPYFTLLEILKLENIFKLKIGALVHYNTRYAANQNLCRPFSRTNYGLARFSVVVLQTWEATPLKIKCLPSNSFETEYKLFILDSPQAMSQSSLVIKISALQMRPVILLCRIF